MEPKADAEEEKDPEHGVLLTQSPSGSGGGLCQGAQVSATQFPHVESCRPPLCCVGSLGKVKTESSTLDRTRLV